MLRFVQRSTKQSDAAPSSRSDRPNATTPRVITACSNNDRPYGDTNDMIRKFGQYIEKDEPNYLCNLANEISEKYKFTGKFTGFMTEVMHTGLRKTLIVFDYDGRKIIYTTKGQGMDIGNNQTLFYNEGSGIVFGGSSEMYNIDDKITERLTNYITENQMKCSADDILYDMYRTSFFLDITGDDHLTPLMHITTGNRCGNTKNTENTDAADDTDNFDYVNEPANEFIDKLVIKCRAIDEAKRTNGDDRFGIMPMKLAAILVGIPEKYAVCNTDNTAYEVRVYSEYATRKCTTCGKPASAAKGLYHCEKCNSSHCINCIWKIITYYEYTDNEYTDTDRAIVANNKCPIDANHTLKKLEAHHPYNCDVCKRSINAGEIMFSCREHDYDACAKCMTPST